MFDLIPQELKDKQRWVCVKKDSKVPFNPTTRRAASSSDPSTWVTFSAANSAVEKGLFDGLGYVFSQEDGYVAIDIDDGFDADGFVTPKAADIINRCESYTELSRSGRGFHIILRGTLPFTGRNNRDGVEIYTSARYFIMTGKRLLFDDIRADQNAINSVLEGYFAENLRNCPVKRQNTRFYAPLWSSWRTDGHLKLRPEYPPIPEGCRNQSLTSLGGTMRSAGYGWQEIWNELSFVNDTACTEPIDEWELRQIINSVTRYK